MTSLPATAPEWRAIERLLAAHIGLDASIIGRTAVIRAVRTRLDAAGGQDLPGYVRLLEGDVAERDRLVEEVVVPESWFFRDRQVFDHLVRHACGLAVRRPRVPIRILSIPCASGEEPYSIAMALLDAGLQPAEFTIDAVDVSRRALERAARGRYSANAFRNADTSFRDRWFQPTGGQSELDARVRGCVHFERGNLLDPLFGLDRSPYDVVFCRNLLIYFDASARQTAERVLGRLLAPEGLLVLGAAEPPILRGDWSAAEGPAVFALRRGTAAAAPRPTSPPSRPSPASARSPSAAAPPAASLADILAVAGSLANAGRHAEALATCERARTGCPPTPELFFLMAVLHQTLGDLDRAEACFHKTLYLDATHVDALLALTLLAERRGDGRMAETYRQSAARIRARRPRS